MSEPLSLGRAAEYVLKVNYDCHGREPGDFYRALMRACFKADEENLARIGLGFPAIAAAVHVYKNTPGGIEVLRLWRDKGQTT